MRQGCDKPLLIGPDAGLVQLIDGKIVQLVTPEEMACELRLIEAEEAEDERASRRIEEHSHRLHPDDHLRTIPGVGEHTAPVFLAAVANWTGVVPGAKQSSDVKGKGLRMTKAGPVMMKRALYQAGDIARQYDPPTSPSLSSGNGSSW